MASTSDVVALKKSLQAKHGTPEASTPIVVIPTVRGSLHFVVVGAGGTGARVVPPLTQMMRHGDYLSIIDHDIVEDRNLLRQHFTAADIGTPKALVLAARYRRPGIQIAAYVRQVIEGEWQMHGLAYVLGQAVRAAHVRPSGTIIIGCVDNAAARRGLCELMIQPSAFATAPVAWIDVGNEMRAGQAMLTIHSWQVRMPMMGAGNLVVHLPGLPSAMPQLLRDAPEDTASCGDRIDLQTVQVNHMAAGAAVNMASWLMLGIPFASCGAFFSTLNTMQPIRIQGYDSTTHTLLPDTQYAIQEESANETQAPAF